MAEIVGYKLVRVSDGTEVASWGGVWGRCPGIPNPLTLPSRLVHVCCALPNASYPDIDEKVYRLVEWTMDEPAATPDAASAD